VKTRAVLVGLLHIAAFSSPGYAQQPRGMERLQLPPTEARGCYYYRGERFCSRYCYYEINSMRYCRERERDAFPQAPADFEIIEPSDRRIHH
jgi:hypothetical protein